MSRYSHDINSRRYTQTHDISSRWPAKSRTAEKQYQGRRIRGFEGARAPPEHETAPSHCQKHPLKMKGKLHETPFQTDIEQSYGGIDVHLRLMSVSNSCNPSFRFELNGHQWKSTPSRLDNSPPMNNTVRPPRS